MSENNEKPQQILSKQHDAHRSVKITEDQNTVPISISRERSFVRSSNNQNFNKRRSLAFNIGNNQQVTMRSKPTMDIYRPPKYNYNVQTSSSSTTVFQSLSPTGIIMQSNSSVQPQMRYIHPPNAMVNRRQAGYSLPNNNSNSTINQFGNRQIFNSHRQPSISVGGVAQQIPLLNSPSSGNILQQASVNRVKFAFEPQKFHNQNKHQLVKSNLKQHNSQTTNLDSYINITPLQRSKSLSSADALTRGIAGLGLVLGNEVTDIGQFNPEVQALIDSALENPNNLTSRNLMEVTTHFIKRAVEGRRYALPISRFCLNIIAKEQKETFLEALLNTCRQWYQERARLLYAIQGMKSPSRLRFTAFMAFLTEMFCQLKRRQLQLRKQYEGAPPSIVLLTLLSKCCEEVVKPPIRSLSEIECLFYVLTCIGQDLELQLPQRLENLLSMIRDAFLNANDSPPAIRRTLLQLIELQASHWQLAGNTVLYYYPSAK